MARKAMRAAKPLGLVALGWALACLHFLGPSMQPRAGPRLFLGRLGRLFLRLSLAHCALRRFKFSRSAAASRSALSPEFLASPLVIAVSANIRGRPSKRVDGRRSARPLGRRPSDMLP